MIATKTTALMVTMAVLGIVPVAAHAQGVDIQELEEQSGTATQASAPSQQATANNVDPDTNTGNAIVFATVGFGGTLNANPTSTVNDPDTLINDQSGQTQTAPAGQGTSQTQTPIQAPTLTVGDLLGLIPGA
jgi:hypothetical protein